MADLFFSKCGSDQGSRFDAMRDIHIQIEVCVIAGSLSGLRQLVEEVVHGAEDFGLVGIEDVVIRVGQTDHLS